MVKNLIMKKILFIFVTIFLLGFSTPKAQEGKASWYGEKFHGKTTANGETYDMNEFTCATTWNPETRRLGYPFGTILKVTNLKNNKSIIVRVNDTGSFSKYGRIIDLSKASFEAIAPLSKGVIKVKIEVLQKP